MKKPHLQAASRPSYLKALQKSSLAFGAMAPLLLGIIGLVGLFQVLVTPKMLASLFRGQPLVDPLIGTLTGAVSAGTPIVSYVIGGELLAHGISLYAVSAFVLSWVTLGFIQLPAEVDVLGGRFTLYRNLLALVFTVLIAVLTTFTLHLLS